MSATAKAQIGGNGWGGGNNYTGAADPTVDNSSADGILVGDTFLNTVSGDLFWCSDNTATAAVWNKVRTNIATTVLTIGASTAAAGSTTTDAGVLPSGTAQVYPTTAADDTKGVRISATDKVQGRRILIGNGVANKLLKVYPPTGGTINGGSADAAYSSASGKSVDIVCLSSASNTWLAIG